MARVAALLAAAVALAAPGCGADGGAEPGASHEAALVLDFQPNAAHAGIYLAAARGLFERHRVELEIRAPSASTDAPKQLAAGRAELAILDIQDLAIARERGLDLVALAPVVDRPLAAVVARAGIRRPAQLDGATVGVTGLPSDRAVLETVLDAAPGPAPKVRRVTIGFQAVPALAAGRIDAATAFRNAEAVELQRRGVRVQVLPVERFGAPPYPELVLVAHRRTLRDEGAAAAGVVRALRQGSRAARDDPDAALDALLAANPDLDRAAQDAQLMAVLPSLGGRLRLGVLRRWSRWAAASGIVRRPPDVARAFAP